MKNSTDEPIENLPDYEDPSSLKILTGKIKSEEDPEYDRKYKSMRWGIITFCFIHLIYEMFTGNVISAGSLVFINFFISLFIASWRLSNNKTTKMPYLLGFAVACIVFIIRLVIGTIIFYSMTT